MGNITRTNAARCTKRTSGRLSRPARTHTAHRRCAISDALTAGAVLMRSAARAGAFRARAFFSSCRFASAALRVNHVPSLDRSSVLSGAPWDRYCNAGLALREMGSPSLLVDDWYETQDIEEPTAQDELRDEITLLDTIIEDCSTLALETKNDAVHLGALKLKLATQVKRLDLKRATGRLPSQLQNVALLAVVDRWTDAFDIMWHKLELQLEEPVFAEFERGVREIIHEDPSVVRARERRERAIAIIGLYATGAYMTSQLWTWGTSWIVLPIVGLAVLSLQGPLVAGRRGHAVKRALMANGPGPLGPEARRMTHDRALWIAGLTNEGLVLGIVWVMVEKSGWASGIAALVIAYVVGVTAAIALTRAPALEAEAVTQPTA